MKYIRNLHNIDDRVPSVSPQIGKEERPFVGIVVMVNGRKYCIPLSKPKEKHNRMKGSIDFTKIIYNGEFLGVLNFNQMIPVEQEQLRIIDINIHKHDNADTRRKKMHLSQWSRRTINFFVSPSSHLSLRLRLPMPTIGQKTAVLTV